MSFRRSVSFNTHDCSVQVGERIHVELGMPQRCGLALRAYCRLEGDVPVEDVTAHINKRRNALYSEDDINSACKKLVKMELMKCVGRRTYRAVPGAMAVWAKVDKTRR